MKFEPKKTAERDIMDSILWPIAAFIISLISSYFTWRQGNDIWDKQSAAGVSSIWMVYFSTYFVGNLIYGYHIDDMPIMINSIIRTCVYAYAAIGIFKYGQLNWKDVLVFVSTVVCVVLLAVLPAKGFILVILSVGSVLAVSSQPRLLYNTKKRGVFRLDLLITFALSTAFWLTYTFLIWDPFLFSIMCAYSILLVMTFVFYFQAESGAQPN